MALPNSFKYPSYPGLEMQEPMRMKPTLTVADAERLAKAGVTIDVEKVDIVSDARPPYYHEHTTLMDPLIHRLRTAFPLGRAGGCHKFQFLSAAYTGCYRVGETATGISLMVVTANGNAALLEDTLIGWPSDALIAKLHLLLETEEKRTVSNNAVIFFAVTRCGPERDFERLREEASLCRQYETAVRVTGTTSLVLSEQCRGWK